MSSFHILSCTPKSTDLISEIKYGMSHKTFLTDYFDVSQTYSEPTNALLSSAESSACCWFKFPSLAAIAVLAAAPLFPNLPRPCDCTALIQTTANTASSSLFIIQSVKWERGNSKNRPKSVSISPNLTLGDVIWPPSSVYAREQSRTLMKNFICSSLYRHWT